MITQAQTGKQDDVVLLVHTMADIQKHTQTPFSMFVDGNIHYRMTKLCYSSTYIPLESRGLLTKVPPIFGIRHPYKYCANCATESFSHCLLQLHMAPLGPLFKYGHFRSFYTLNEWLHVCWSLHPLCSLDRTSV